MMALLLLAALLVPGCDLRDPCTYRHDALDGDEGLHLTQAEHVIGWGHTDCMVCHQAWQIHPVECIDECWVDMIQRNADVGDTYSCTACHGDNGNDEGDWMDTTSSASR